MIGQGGPLMQLAVRSPQTKDFKRAHCVWKVNKNSFLKYLQSWISTCEREWDPNVARQLSGSMAFDPANPDCFWEAARLSEIFVMAHISTDEKDSDELLTGIQRARGDGRIQGANGRAVIEYILSWIVIKDPAEQTRARKAIAEVTLLPSMNKHQIAETYTGGWRASSHAYRRRSAPASATSSGA